MSDNPLSEALEREHRDIDAGIDAFTSLAADAQVQPEPLTVALAALRRHIYLEEEFVFPPLYAAGMTAPLFVMLREHGQIWASMDALDRALATGASHAELALLCKQLATQLQHHNLMEERIVYPEADRGLAGDQAAQLRRFLDTGRVPDGWTCHKAPR